MLSSKPTLRFQEAPGKPNAAIARPVTVGMNVTAPAVIAIRDISYVMDCVREGRFENKDLRALISTIRGLGERQAGIAAGMKRSLPWFSGSTFNQRRANDRFQAAWFMVFDIDHVEDIPGLKAKAVERLAFVRHAFQSVRDGVKLVAEFTSPITLESDYRTIWNYLALRIEHSLKVTVDATPDPARACFLSYDPELVTNFRCLPYVPKKVLEEVKALEALVPPVRPVELILVPIGLKPSAVKAQQRPRYEASDFEKASKIVQKLAQMRIPYSDWYRVGLALYAGFGEAGRPLWDLFLNNPHYQDQQWELDAKWRSFRGVREITLATLFEIGGQYGL